MHTKNKVNELMIDLKETFENDDIEEALTLLSMIKNAEQLEDWLSE